MNDQLAAICARVDGIVPCDDEAAILSDDAKALLKEMVRYQDWLAAMAVRSQAGPYAVEIPPAGLLKVMDRDMLYAEGVALGFAEVGQWAASALMGDAAPDEIEIAPAKSQLKMSAWQRFWGWLTGGRDRR